MAAKKLTKKALDNLIQKTYGTAAQGRVINVMDIGKVFRAGQAAYVKDGTVESVEAAVKDAVAKLTKTYEDLENEAKAKGGGCAHGHCHHE